MVLDLKMPGIDGLEVLRRGTKNISSNPGGNTNRPLGLKKTKPRPADWRVRYLQKPVDIEKLVKVLRKLDKSKVEDTMGAAAFAEEGEFRTAREIVAEEKKGR